MGCGVSTPSDRQPQQPGPQLNPRALPEGQPKDQHQQQGHPRHEPQSQQKAEPSSVPALPSRPPSVSPSTPRDSRRAPSSQESNRSPSPVVASPIREPAGPSPSSVEDPNRSSIIPDQPSPKPLQPQPGPQPGSQQTQQQVADDQHGSIKLLELLKKGVPLAAKAVAALGPALPFPGAQAAALLGTLLGMADRAIANHDNLKELQRRSVAYLDLLAAYHSALVRVRVYKAVVEEYKEQLRGVVAYTEAYLSRNCILKFFTGGSDKEHYEALCAGLADLSKRTTLALQAENLERTEDVQDKVDQALACLQPAVEYFDASAQMRKAVEEAGGVDMLIAKPQLLERAMGHMDTGLRVGVEMVLSVLRAQADKGPHRHIRHPDLRLFWRKHFEGAVDVPWSGFFCYFPDQLYDDLPPDDGTMCASTAAAIPALSATGACANSTSPASSDASSGTVLSRLRQLLNSAAAKLAFKLAVDMDGDDRVSVYELRLAFDGEGELSEQVQRILSLTGPPSQLPPPSSAAQALGADRSANGGASRDGGASHTGKQGEAEESFGCSDSDIEIVREGSGGPEGRRDSSGSSDSGSDSSDAEAPNGRCMLPPPDPNLVGREEEARDIASHLMTTELPPEEGSWIAWNMVLKAPGGMGKSSLAVAVGWDLLTKGRSDDKFMAGAYWLDLREATTPAAVEARFCAALGITKEEACDVEAGNIHRIVDYVKLLSGANVIPSVLLVVDNAEDALHQAPAAALLHAILKELSTVLGLRVLVTSRESLKLDHKLYTERQVRPLSLQAAARVVLAAVQDLSAQQAEEVAAACSRVPLYLRLVSEALVAGRLTIENIRELRTHPSAAATAATSSLPKAGATANRTEADPLLLIVRSLKPAHGAAMTQLAVFPSAFDAEAAAAVLQISPQQTQALLAVLYASGLLLRGGRLGVGYFLHKALRQALLTSADQAHMALFIAAEGRYALHFLRLLGQWADMYASKEHGLAVAMARDCQPDLTRLAELLAAKPKAMGKAGVSGSSSNSPSGLQETLIKMQQAADAVAGQDTDIGRALSYSVCAFVEALGALSVFEPGWEALRAAAERAGDPVRQANFLNLLARVALGKGRYAEAQQKAEGALRLLLAAAGGKKEAQLAAQPVPTAAALNNLGVALKAQRKAEKAEPILRQALALRKRSCGEAHFDTAGTMQNLASCLKAQGKLEPAMQLYDKVLGLQKEALSDSHPALGLTLNSFANCLVEQGNDLDTASELYGHALEVQMRFLGEEHSHTLASKVNLARCWLLVGDAAESGELVQDVLWTLERVKGRKHPDTLAAVTILARCELQQENYAGAASLYERLLAESPEGELEPRNEASARANLAKCLQKLGLHSKAEPQCKRLLELRTELMGADHAETLAAKSLLAECLKELRKYDEAEVLFGQLVEVQERVVGKDSDEALGSVRGWALCLQGLRRYAEAEPLLQRVMDSRIQVYGMAHKDTVAAVVQVAECLVLQRKFKEAMELQELLASLRRAEGGGGGGRGAEAEAQDRKREASKETIQKRIAVTYSAT